MFFWDPFTWPLVPHCAAIGHQEPGLGVYYRFHWLFLRVAWQRVPNPGQDHGLPIPIRAIGLALALVLVPACTTVTTHCQPEHQALRMEAPQSDEDPQTEKICYPSL